MCENQCDSIIYMIKSALDESFEGDQLQVKCIACNAKATIQSTSFIDPKVSDLYCTCKDPHCGHSFVVTVSFKHTLSPAASHTKNMVVDLLRMLPKNEQMELLNAATSSRV